MRLLTKLAVITVLALFGVLGNVVCVLAVDVPAFPSCLNPSGTVKANYTSGNHGIVGSALVYTGSDVVYQVDEINLTQCFCSIDGNGVQTNWWRIGSLDSEQIQTLKNLGWYYVPTGAAWGLLDTPYMAKNEAYACGSSQGGTTVITTSSSQPGAAGAPICTATKPQAPQLISVVKTGSKAVVTWTKVANATYYNLAYGTTPGVYPYGVPNTGNQTSYTVSSLDSGKTYYFVVRAVNDCMPSDPSGSYSAVLGASTGIGGQVLGLAATGNEGLLYGLAGSGILLLLLGYVLRKRPETD